MSDIIQSKPSTPEYADGWDRIFSKANKQAACPACNGTGKSKFADYMLCEVCNPKPKESVQVCQACGEPWADHTWEWQEQRPPVCPTKKGDLETRIP